MKLDSGPYYAMSLANTQSSGGHCWEEKPKVLYALTTNNLLVNASAVGQEDTTAASGIG
ncbi:hypothetical protein BH11BAC5_BH11BAC5_14870 [soil metagenome]